MAKCKCVGSSGEKKTKFSSRQAAVTSAIRRGWAPTVYRCPDSKNWHITHGKDKR